jgi:hypothetical protein
MAIELHYLLWPVVLQELAAAHAQRKHICVVLVGFPPDASVADWLRIYCGLARGLARQFARQLRLIAR